MVGLAARAVGGAVGWEGAGEWAGERVGAGWAGLEVAAAREVARVADRDCSRHGEADASASQAGEVGWRHPPCPPTLPTHPSLLSPGGWWQGWRLRAVVARFNASHSGTSVCSGQPVRWTAVELLSKFLGHTASANGINDKRIDVDAII